MTEKPTYCCFCNTSVMIGDPERKQDPEGRTFHARCVTKMAARAIELTKHFLSRHADGPQLRRFTAQAKPTTFLVGLQTEIGKHLDELARTKPSNGASTGFQKELRDFRAMIARMLSPPVVATLVVPTPPPRRVRKAS